MTAFELTRDDNPRWLAAVTTALPVALAALFVMWWCQPDARRLPAAVPLSKPAPANVPAEAQQVTTVARAQ